MMGKTHKAGGALAMLIAFQYMQHKGWLSPDLHPIVQLLVMYPACSWGSTAPDLDQGDDTIPEKTPVSILVHKLIYLGKVRHRSWQTHSLIVTGGFACALFFLIDLMNTYNLFHLNVMSVTILNLLVIGMVVGIASHLFLDLLTYEGIPLGPPVYNKKAKRKKIIWLRLAPHTDTFKTNTTYEKGVRFLLYVGIILALLYPAFNYFKQYI